jgi:hypothetical protein
MVTSMRWTIADVEALPERLDDHRYEIIGGELYVSSQPDWRHQLVGDSIWEVLNRWNQVSGAGMAITAPCVIFSPEDAVALEADDTLRSPHLPGFQAAVSEFFGQIPDALHDRTRWVVGDDDD